MAENFEGVKSIHPDISPSHDTLKGKLDIVEPPDLSEMDKNYAELLKKKDGSADPDPNAPAPDPNAPAPSPDPNAPVPSPDPNASASPAPSPDPNAPPVPPAPDPNAAPPAPPQPDLYPEVQLPAGTKGKSAEAFATIKANAARDLSERDQKITTLETRVRELEASRSEPLTPEIKQELEELRQFRIKLDIEADPTFSAKYVSGIEKLRGFIYEQLKGTGKVSDDLLKKMKELGGPDEVANIDRVFEQIENPQVQRLVQAKLDEIEVLKFEKKRALEVAKSDVNKYISERQEAFARSIDGHRQETEKHLKVYEPKLPFLADPIPPAASASETEKKFYSDTVEHRKQIREYVKIALQDDSAEMRATLIAGVAQLLNLKREHSILSAQADGLKKQLDAANSEIEKFKKASVGRIRNGSAAPPNDKLPAAPNKMDLSIPGGIALDELRKTQASRV